MLSKFLKRSNLHISKISTASFEKTQRSLSTEISDPIIKTELKNNILYVTFNRPKTFNAFTSEMGDEFMKLVQYTQAAYNAPKPEEVVKCVIFTGADKAFSAGGDRGFLFDRHHDNKINNMIEMNRFYEKFLSVRHIPVPTIAAINGAAVGAGACFSLVCDYRIALKSAKIGFIFTKLNLHPGLGGTHYLPKIVGPQAASKLLISGELISGQQAKEIGLIAEVLEEPSKDTNENNEHLLKRATEIAEQYTKVHSTASFILLRTLRSQMSEGLEKALLRESEAQAACYNEQAFFDNVTANAAKKK